MKRFVHIAFLVTVIISINQHIDGISAEIFGRERLFLIEERVVVKNLRMDKSGLRIWIPYPTDDDSQKIIDISIQAASADLSLITEREYGNQIIFLRPKQHILDKAIYEMILSFKVRRKESNAFSDTKVSYETLSRFLKSDRVVLINGRIEILAREITKGKSDELEKARAIYDYIISELTYSKDDPNVCGVGDSLLTLRYKKGICSDYHSLFISLVRSLGIPAKFEIGLAVPSDKKEGRIGGYHCWAKFYIKDKGWIPVDISEADKHLKRRDYFFGHIDENRVRLTTGRDIRLEYSNTKEPLNFFVWPYAELNGTKYEDMDVEFSFKELEGGMIMG